MKYVRIHVPTEVRKAMKGKKTKVGIVALFRSIAPHYLEMAAALEAQAGEQKGVDELERMYRLEDPRRQEPPE
jgi:hypothetical protein